MRRSGIWHEGKGILTEVVAGIALTGDPQTLRLAARLLGAFHRLNDGRSSTRTVTLSAKTATLRNRRPLSEERPCVN